MTLRYSEELDVAKQAARQAGDFLRVHLGSVRAQEVTYKGDIDIVTPYDLEAQRLVVESIKAAFPDHSFLTEERQKKVNGSGSVSRWIVRVTIGWPGEYRWAALMAAASCFRRSASSDRCDSFITPPGPWPWARVRAVPPRRAAP